MRMPGAIILVFVLAHAHLLPADEPVRTAPGTYEEKLEHGGRTRTYRLHIPPGYDGSKPVPLVLAFHGGGGSSQNAETGYGFNPLSDQHGFLVVYPDGIAHYWHDGRISPRFQVVAEVDDVGFLRTLLDKLSNKYRIDPERIYATGNSNGGFISQRLGWELSDRLAAIAPSAGTLGQEIAPSFAPRQPVHVLHIHGTKDASVPYEGGMVINQGGLAISVAEMMRLWVKANGCKEKPLVEYLPKSDAKDPTRVRKETYAPGPKGAEVVLLAIEGHGHNWPGRGKAGTRQLNAAEVVWDFFVKHPKVRQ